MKKWMTKADLFKYASTLLPPQADGTKGLSSVSIDNILVRFAGDIKKNKAGLICVNDFQRAALESRNRKKAILQQAVEKAVQTESGATLQALKVEKMQREITLLAQRIALFDGKYLSAESWQGLADEHLTICCAMLAELVQWVEADFRTPEAVRKARQIENKGRRLLRDAVERKYLEAQAESTGGPA